MRCCWSRLRNCIVVVDVVAGVGDVAVEDCRDVRFGYMWEWVMPRS